MATMNYVRVPYAKCREKIWDADVLLFRGDRWYERAIGIAGRSTYCHAGLAAWWHDRVHVLQQTGFEDHKPLLSQVLATGYEELDVYRADLTAEERESVVREMIEIVGQKYGWRNLAAVALRHIPLARLLIQPEMDDLAQSAFPPFCSAAVSRSFRLGVEDLVPNLSDDATEPGDLARSALLRYQFTPQKDRILSGDAKIQQIVANWPPYKSA